MTWDAAGFPDAEQHERCCWPAPEDDFFCLRYRVWYPSLDCAFRTRFQTCPGCRNCEQGRFNYTRHALQIARREPSRAALD
jgi:hypothetical protein